MVMIPWQYYRNLTSFKQQMNQLFDRFFESELSRCGALIPSDPKTTIRETRYRFLVTIEVKGFSQKDLTVSFDGTVLTIEGRKRSPERTPDGFSTVNSFQRVVRFKHNVKTDGVIARYCDDKLVIVIPKEQPQEPRSIRIMS